MSDDTDTTATPPTDTPKPESHAPEAAPQAEASIEQVTEPDPEHAPEPVPAPPPELAEVAAVEAQSEAPAPETAEEPSEALAPVSHPESEQLVPVHDTHAAIESAVTTPTEEPTEAATEESTEPPATEETEPAAEAPIEALEEPAEEPQAEEPKTEDEQPATKPKRTRKPKTAAEPEEPTGTVAGGDVAAEAPAENNKKWYAIKVQSGREDTIKAAILRKVKIEGLEEYLGRIEIPVEEEIVKKTVRVKDKKTGDYTTQEKKVTRKKKKFQGYLFAELEFNDRILYLFRETAGVGDFLNLRGVPPVPEPMPEHEVQAMLTGVRAAPVGKGGKVKVKLDFEKGDRVRVREGSFANQEGEVKAITEPKDPNDTPKVTVVLTFWGRPLEVELEYWQVEKV
jgi:transcriptional antiterminator NusG